MLIARKYLKRSKWTLREYVKRMRITSIITSLATSVGSILILHFYLIRVIKETEGKDYTPDYSFAMSYTVITTVLLSMSLGFFAVHLITKDD